MISLLVLMAAATASAALLHLVRYAGILPDTSWMSTAILVVSVTVAVVVSAAWDSARAGRDKAPEQ